MMRGVWILGCSLVAASLPAVAEDNPVVFRSDVSLVRVDAQVVDRDNRAVTGLRAEDFILREEGRQQQIRNFASEDMPLDVLLLLDVSASMRPHVQRIASAAHQALRVLREDDRVGIMVFDRSTRVRLPFRSSREDVEREFDSLLRQETFNGGTDITRGLLDAADYVASHARPEVRRAIVILTDDQTERDRDEERVGRALTRANAVLSALIAPDAMQNRGMGRQGGGGWPGGGGGRRGGVIFGPGGGGPWGGSPWPGGGGGGRRPGGGVPGMGGSRTQSAGTSEIARTSGGDSLPVSDASALETTLSRLRQRYALHFYLPRDVSPGQERAVEVELAAAALQRYPGAEVRYRRAYFAPETGGRGNTAADTAVVTRAGSTAGTQSIPEAPSGSRRRRAVNGPVSDGPAVDTTGSDGSWRRAEDPAPQAAPQAAPAPAPSTDQDSNSGGWRKLKPGEQP